MMKKSAFLTFFLCVMLTTSAQVKVSMQKVPVNGTDDLIDLVFSFAIDRGWHVYGPDNSGGPIPLTFNAEALEGAVLEGKLRTQPSPIKKMDDMFGCEVTYFERQLTATQRLRLKGGAWKAQGYLEYGACNDKSCLPPTSVEFRFEGKQALTKSSDKTSETSQTTQTTQTLPPPSLKGREQSPLEGENTADTKDTEDTGTENTKDTEDTDTEDTDTEDIDTEDTDTEDIESEEATEPTKVTTPPLKGEAGEGSGAALDGSGAALEGSRSTLDWSAIFLLGILGGLIALVTPCVWPIIPMTVSFFLKRAKDDRRRGIRDAVLYGLSIIIIYVGLGLLVTLLWGPAALNALSTNAVFNLFLFALLVVFAASFLGGFELTLPSSWSTKIDAKASSTTGILSIFLMAATLVLVSFSCTGPIIGLLLVDMVTSGSVVAPTIGMLGFAIALAAPFTLFAIFPTWLKSAPKSGNWMNVVKVVLGLIELAFALKFLSVADLAYGWRLLDRETFLCLWIVIFALMGFYLLGWIRLPHDEDEYDDDGNVIARPRIGVTRFFAALVALAFALYMVPGLWGAPCKAVSAFAPPMWTQDFRLDRNSVEASYTDYETGIEAARKAGKPIMLDFTGFGCVNCRKMEAAVWPDARVRKLMTEDYVLISLYVDDKTPLPSPIDVTEADGTPRRLRTVGDRWSYLQRTKFGSQTQPFYVLIDHNARPLAPAYSYDEDISHFVEWLEQGLNRFNEPNN